MQAELVAHSPAFGNYANQIGLGDSAEALVPRDPLQAVEQRIDAEVEVLIRGGSSHTMGSKSAGSASRRVSLTGAGGRTLQPGYAEFRGRYHRFGRLVMRPAPKMAVPIYIGGHSEPALRRAARLADGWISAQISAREVPGVVSSLRDELAAAGREDVPFEIKVTPLIPATPEAFAAVGEGGATDVVTMPWMYYGGTSLDAKIDGLHRFADEIIHVIRS